MPTAGVMQTDSGITITLGELTPVKDFNFSRHSVMLDMSQPDSPLTLFGNEEDRSERSMVEIYHWAYNLHGELVIAPDDWHVKLMTGLIALVQHFPEDFRTHIASGNAKRVLTVNDDRISGFDSRNEASINRTQAQLAALLPQQFSAQLQSVVHNQALIDIVLQAYSTSSENDANVKAALFMGVCCPYYEYELTTFCQHPQIKLEGSVADWQLLANFPNRLRECFDLHASVLNEGQQHLKQWLGILEPTLQDAYCSRAAELNPEQQYQFWSSFYRYKGDSGHDDVTGPAKYFYPVLANGDLNPWVYHDLLPSHLKQSDGSINQDKLNQTGPKERYCRNFQSIPFAWQYFFTSYKATLEVGITGVEVKKLGGNNEGVSVRAQRGVKAAFVREQPKPCSFDGYLSLDEPAEPGKLMKEACCVGLFKACCPPAELAETVKSIASDCYSYLVSCCSSS